MFQNITEEEKQEKTIEEQEWTSKINIKEILSKVFTKQNILVYIISFMVSMVSTVNGIAPFALAIFAATLSNGLPAGVVFVFSLIGTLIRDRWRRSTYIYIYCTCFYWNGATF